MQGHVYILVNSAYPGLVKIGKTTKDPSVRARELSQTGVPTAFVVAYSAFVSDCDSLEADLHTEFAEYRESNRREFFRIESKTAIDTLISRSTDYCISDPVSREAQTTLTTATQAFYICLFPSDDRDSHTVVRKDFLDSPQVVSSLRPAFDSDFDDAGPTDTVYFYPNWKHPHDRKLYRFGFTSIPATGIDSEISNYFMLRGVLASTVCVHHEYGVHPFDSNLICEEFATHILSKSEQLIFADQATLASLMKFVKHHSRLQMEKAGAEKETLERLENERQALEVRKRI